MSFCRAPSSSLHLDPKGDVRVCCQNEFMRLGNIADASLLALWEGERRERLRRAVDAHDLSLGCEQCARSVRTGGAATAYARVFDHLEAAPGAGEWPVQLELALSNACNLQCVMCNGELSSAIRVKRERRPPLPTVYDDRFFEELDDFLVHARSIVLLGGEPLLAPESLRVLDRLAALGVRPHVSITTNGTQWSPRIERALGSVPVHLTVSLDGATSETVEAARVGVDRSKVLANLGLMRTVVEGAGGTVSLSYCMMRSNWRELHPLLRWADGEGLEVFVNSVTHPPHLSLVHLALPGLIEVVESLRRTDREAASLERNRSVWERELATWEQVAEQRGRPSGRDGTGTPEPPHHAPRGATVVANSIQVIASVEAGDAERFGVDLECLVGASIWSLPRALGDSLGELVTSELEERPDGGEHRRLAFDAHGTQTVVDAVLEHLPDGGQRWALGFRRVDPVPIRLGRRRIGRSGAR